MNAGEERLVTLSVFTAIFILGWAIGWMTGYGMGWKARGRAG